MTSLWQISTEVDKETAVWLLDKPFKTEEGDVIEVNLGNAAVALAPFLDEVELPANTRYQPTATLTKDPLYRSVLSLRG